MLCTILCILLSLVSKEACMFLANTICILYHCVFHSTSSVLSHPHSLRCLPSTWALQPSRHSQLNLYACTKPTQMSSQTATPLLSSTLQSPSAKEMWVLPLEEALGLGSACGIHLCLEVRSMMRVKHIFIKSYCCLVAKSCPTLCDPRDCRLPDLSVHVILRYSCLAQARIL